MAKSRDETVIRTHNDLVKIIRDYRKRFEKKENLKISDPQATKKIAEKIAQAGGIKI